MAKVKVVDCHSSLPWNYLSYVTLWPVNKFGITFAIFRLVRIALVRPNKLAAISSRCGCPGLPLWLSWAPVVVVLWGRTCAPQ